MYIWDLVHGYLHRFEIVQVTFLRKGAGVSDFTRAAGAAFTKRNYNWRVDLDPFYEEERKIYNSFLIFRSLPG